MTLRRGFSIAALVVVAGFLLHGFTWFVFADRLEAGIDEWAADRRAEGWLVAYGEPSVSGFPFDWRARMAEPRLRQARTGPAFAWSGPWIEIGWRPWSANAVAFRTAGRHRVALGASHLDRPLPVDVAAVRGRLAFDEKASPRLLALEIDDAVVAPPDGEAIRFDRLVAMLEAPLPEEGGEAGHRRPSLRFDGVLSGLLLPEGSRPALGRRIEVIALHGTVRGAVPAAALREALERWRAAGGTVEVEHLELGWSALTVRGGGTLALDAGLQPVGAMAARISGFNETVDSLLAAGLVKPGQALVAKAALGALARPPEDGGPPQIEVPLAVQERWLFVGPVRLVPVPPVRWE